MIDHISLCIAMILIFPAALYYASNQIDAYTKKESQLHHFLKCYLIFKAIMMEIAIIGIFSITTEITFSSIHILMAIFLSFHCILSIYLIKNNETVVQRLKMFLTKKFYR